MVRGQSLVEAIKTLILGISAAERLVKLSRNLCMRFGIQDSINMFLSSLCLESKSVACKCRNSMKGG